MGMDFCAIFEYPGPTPPVLRSVERLEAGKSCKEFRAVLERWRDDFRPLRPECARWIRWTEGVEVDARPELPTREYFLRTTEFFCLTFGADAIYAYHPLRWGQFLSVKHWQSTMLNAVAVMCRWMCAGECILTSDFSAAVASFREGRSYREVITDAAREDGEVATIADLYWEQADDEHVFKPVAGGEPRTVKWPADIPVPPGWERPTTWDSKGFWKFPWRERIDAFGLSG